MPPGPGVRYSFRPIPMRQAQLRVPAAHAPEAWKAGPLEKEGAGNAGCATQPQPCVQMKKARKQVTTGTPKRSGTPCAMVLRRISRSPRCAGLFSHRRLARRVGPKGRHRQRARLDTSVGVPGPHDFVVRLIATRPAPITRPSHPAATSVTTRTPLVEAGWAETNHGFLKNGRGIFLPVVLDMIF